MHILNETQSLCPICHQAVYAYYAEVDEVDKDAVYFIQKCPEHGEFRTLAARTPEDYQAWIRNPVLNVPPKYPITKGADERTSGSSCPLHCGTCENHLQTACCVLIDITERCNQHCPYCFAEAGKPGSEPSLDEIRRKYDLLLELGEDRPFNIQLSGGEPTVREDLPEIIRMGAEKGFDYIQINSNGKRLGLEKDYAGILREAGASVIFMQFDGTEDDINLALRNEALLDIKKAAIRNCREAALPVTLVPTIVKDINLSNIGAMIDFMLDNLDVVKGIHFQPVSYFGRYPKAFEAGGTDVVGAGRVTMFDVMHAIQEQTGGRFQYNDLLPISTGHPLCCFYGSYIKEPRGNITSTVGQQKRASGISCCDASSPIDIIRKDRDFVVNKWNLPGPAESACCDCSAKAVDSSGRDDDGVMDFDSFLRYIRSRMFTLSGMAFQDLSNLDAERLKRCRVQVLSDDDRLIPFCAYNSIYRK